MRFARILAVVVTGVMVAAIGLGAASGDFASDASSIWSLAWGKVTLVDLYLGLAIFGAWVVVRERSAGRVIVWWLALLVLGNLAAGVYLLRASYASGDMMELLTGRVSEG
jgi:hypothetical protein